ncbi:MAG: hypothetical protein K5869_04985 [Saccharofermentans sp.]|nr:hypothetical protein [Saccharofermentans sp.]
MGEKKGMSEPYTGQLTSNAKLFSILAYFGALWLLGLLINPDKTCPFVRHHVNNGILLLIGFGVYSVIGGLLISRIPYIGWLLNLGAYACLVFVMIKGIVSAAKTQLFNIPLVNGIKIVK